jgi:hypothetical protein
LIARDALANDLRMFIDPNIRSCAEHASDSFAKHDILNILLSNQFLPIDLFNNLVINSNCNRSNII